MNELKVFSGKCCLCDVGIPAKANSTFGDEIEIHTGDIVIIWHGTYIGTDIEEWLPSDGLTAIVADQYQSYSNGDITVQKASPEPYPMGIKDCGFSDPEWRIQVVKKFSDVIEGERWPAYGFHFAKSETAESAMAKSIEGAA